jgi:hypothetical protein
VCEFCIVNCDEVFRNRVLKNWGEGGLENIKFLKIGAGWEQK